MPVFALSPTADASAANSQLVTHVLQVEVSGILVEDGKAVGVTTDKAGEIRAPVTISDAGAINTFEKLLSEEVCEAAGIPRTITSSLKPGRSHMTAFVSLDGVYQDFGLRASNIHSFPGMDGMYYI